MTKHCIENKGKPIKIQQSDRIDLLVKTIKQELVKDYDNYKKYRNVKEEDITDLVCI